MNLVFLSQDEDKPTDRCEYEDERSMEAWLWDALVISLIECVAGIAVGDSEDALTSAIESVAKVADLTNSHACLHLFTDYLKAFRALIDAGVVIEFFPRLTDGACVPAV